jgi:hypothetical protein
MTYFTGHSHEDKLSRFSKVITDIALDLVGRASCPSFLDRRDACPTNLWLSGSEFRPRESDKTFGNRYNSEPVPFLRSSPKASRGKLFTMGD